MANILFSTAQIGDAYAPSLNAAFQQIYEESGIKPVVLSPLGGERTIAQEKSVGGTGASDHVKKRAVDINNQRQLRNWNQTRFLAIMAQHGWHNVTEAGTPFQNEPWHFANQSSTPAGGNVNPINNETSELMSFKLAYVTDNNGNLYTLFDLVHGRYDQTRDAGVANLWDLLYMPSGVSAQNFGSTAPNGSLGTLLTNGAFVHEAWPWKPKD